MGLGHPSGELAGLAPDGRAFSETVIAGAPAGSSPWGRTVSIRNVGKEREDRVVLLSERRHMPLTSPKQRVPGGREKGVRP